MKDQTVAAPAGRDSAPRPPTRLVQREPSDLVAAIGLRDPWLGDLYHHRLTLPWWAFLLGLAAVYLALNMLFAVLYLLGDTAIANARPGAFSDAFFFSVETRSTIGYGQMSPATLYGNIVMTVEAIFGLILLAASARVVLARLSRPTACVRFSKVAFICGLVISVSVARTAEAVEPEKQPIYSNTIGGLLCGSASTSQCKVPAGQRLIIEHVSGFVFEPVSPKQSTVVSMVVTDPGLGLNGNSFHTFSAIKVNTSGPTDVFAFFTPMRVMLHPNATFWFSNVAGVAVSGYLVKFAGP